KAQAFRGNVTSEFSPVVSTESGYAFYPPEIEVNLLPDQTVEVKVHDRSYLDYSYELYGWNADEGTYSINQTFQLLDSGETFMVVDNNVIAGETYTYHVNVTLDCDGYPTV